MSRAKRSFPVLSAQEASLRGETPNTAPNTAPPRLSQHGRDITRIKGIKFPKFPNESCRDSTGPSGEQRGTHLVQGQHQERAPAAGVHDDGDEPGVDGTEGAVPGDAGDADVVVALVIFHRLAENVPKFALPYHSPHRVCGEELQRVAVSSAPLPSSHRHQTRSLHPQGTSSRPKILTFTSILKKIKSQSVSNTTQLRFLLQEEVAGEAAAALLPWTCSLSAGKEAPKPESSF